MEDSEYIRNIEVDGVELSVDMRRFEDPRFTYALGKLSDSTVDSFERLKYANKMLDTLFGDETYRIMCELADRNGGTLDNAQWSDFYANVMEAVSAKNS